MQNKILIALLAIVLSTACKKNSTEEPKKIYTPTQTGQNILYCKINGEERVYEKIYGLFDNDNVNVHTPHHPDSSGVGIYITAYGKPEIADKIALYVDVAPEKINNGKVIPDLNKPYKITNHILFNKSTYVKDQLYNVDSTTSIMTFTRFDDEVASGTFYFEAYSEDGNKVTATDGFFDIEREK